MEITKIDERIKLPIPPNMGITTRTTPVIWFGNYERAKVCSISINPSDKEFYRHPKGQDDYVIPENLLRYKTARLCSREELKKDDNEPLNDSDAKKIKEYCNNYFNKNPYKGWFSHFEYFLNKIGGYSYYDGTCVHLDMVQWATTPTWGGLQKCVREKHIINDLPILKQLLEKDFEVMFLNGKSVVKNISKQLKIKLSEKTALINSNKIYIYTGEYNKTKVIGWNHPLQRSVLGNPKNKDILCDLITNLCGLMGVG
jgi:hypothetical protein